MDNNSMKIAEMQYTIPGAWNIYMFWLLLNWHLSRIFEILISASNSLSSHKDR